MQSPVARDSPMPSEVLSCTCHSFAGLSFEVGMPYCGRFCFRLQPLVETILFFSAAGCHDVVRLASVVEAITEHGSIRHLDLSGLAPRIFLL